MCWSFREACRVGFFLNSQECFAESLSDNQLAGGAEVMRVHVRQVIHVDPRFTRTSAVADHYVPIRAGSDIAFLGGLTSWLIENNRYFREYVVTYTNAATIIGDEYQDTEELDGVFSGLMEYTGDPPQSRADILTHTMFQDVRVHLFAKHSATQWVEIGTFDIPRKVLAQ